MSTMPLRTRLIQISVLSLAMAGLSQAAETPAAAAPPAAKAATPAATVPAPKVAAPVAAPVAVVAAPVANTTTPAPAAAPSVPATPAVAPTPTATAVPAPARAAAAATAAPARQVRQGKVFTNVLNVRARPGKQYEVIAKFKSGDTVQVVGEIEGWCEVIVPVSAEAWIASRFMDANSAVAVDRVKVHSGPGMVFSIYGFVKKGDVLKKIGEPTADGWQKFEPTPDLTAWVAREFVTFDVAAAASTAAPAAAASPAATPAAASAIPAAPVAATTVPAHKLPISSLPTPPATAPKAGTIAAVPPPPADVAKPAATVAESAKPAPAPVAATPAVPAPPVATAPVTPAVVATVPPPPADVVKPAAVTPATPAVSDTLSNLPAAGTTVPSPTPAATAAATVAPPPAAPTAVPQTAEAAATIVTKDGYLSSLKDQSTATATHLLSMKMDNTLYPVCYLISKTVNLTDSERKKVRVTGRQIWYPGWKRSVIDVSSITVVPE